MSAILQRHLFLVIVLNAIVIVSVLLSAVANETTDHVGESQQGSRVRSLPSFFLDHFPRSVMWCNAG
jgi:hypothetical protein